MRTVRGARRRVAAIAGLLAGALTGAATVALAGASVAQRAVDPSLEPYIEATHLPPLLTLAGERAELRFDIHCVSGAETAAEAPCDAGGTVFVRPGTSGPFREVALVEDPAAVEGRFAAVVPEPIVRSPRGFSYYALVRDRSSGATTTLPAGGADAPQRSLPVDRPVEIALGAHAFGSVRPATARAIETTWGDAADEAGLEQGRNLPPIGASSFDVDAEGAVHLLDEAHRRVLRWSPGDRTPERVPLAIDGTIADLAVGRDGALHVLETVSGREGGPLLRTFDSRGRPIGATRVHERAAQVRLGRGDRPIVREQASSQWQPAVGTDGRALTPAEQRAAGTAGRPLRDAGEVVVLRRDNEVLVALVTPAGPTRSWRVRSATPVGEVQLAEPLGRGLLLVVRVYAASQDEFVALVLSEEGLASRFAVASADWAETAPLSRFRLHGSTLYQLGSTATRVFVDRFDLEVE